MFQQCLGKLEKPWSSYTVANLFLAVNSPKSISFLYTMFNVEELFVEECSLIICTEFELTFGDSGNTIYFLFFHDTVFPTLPENHNTKTYKKGKRVFL